MGLILTTSPIAELAGPEPIHPLVRTFVRTMHIWVTSKARTLFWSVGPQKVGSSGSVR